MTNELDRAIASINRHLLYSRLCSVFINEGKLKSCLQMMGIDFETADEEPDELQTKEEVQETKEEIQDEQTVDNTEETKEIPNDVNEVDENIQEQQKPKEDTPKKKRGRKKKVKESEGSETTQSDDFEEAYKKTYKDVVKNSDENGQTDG